MAENKHPGGRPTKYKQEYCNKIIDYFNIEPYETIQLDNGRKERIPNMMPTFEGFACEIDVVITTLHNWCDEHEEFLVAYNKCKAFQKNILMVNGLMGFYNGHYAKFVSINITDMRDEKHIEHSGEMTTNNMTDTEIEKRLAEIERKLQ